MLRNRDQMSSTRRLEATALWSELPVDLKTLCARQIEPFPILARFPSPEGDCGHPTHDAHATLNALTIPGVNSPNCLSEPEEQPKPQTTYLLYSIRDCQKVAGSNLRWDENKRRLVDTGINYVLPVEYPGWFQILTPENLPLPAVPLVSVGVLAASKSSMFLVHSPVIGYWPTESPTSKTVSFREFRIPAGEKLTRGPVFAEPKNGGLGFRKGVCCFRRLGPKKDIPQNDRLYLQCTTTYGTQVLLPFVTRGHFSCIGISVDEEGPAAMTAAYLSTVFQLSDLMKWTDLPQTVRLVHGMQPYAGKVAEPGKGFTGLLRLGDAYFEKSIIACQIPDEECPTPAFLEFPEDSGVELLLADNWDALKLDVSIIEALDFCRRHSESYKLEIQSVIGSTPFADKRCRSRDRSADVIQQGTTLGKRQQLQWSPQRTCQTAENPPGKERKLPFRAPNRISELLLRVNIHNVTATNDKVRHGSIALQEKKRNKEVDTEQKRQTGRIANPRTIEAAHPSTTERTAAQTWASKSLDRNALQHTNPVKTEITATPLPAGTASWREAPVRSRSSQSIDPRAPSKRLSSTSYSSGPMRDRKLPPLPINTIDTEKSARPANEETNGRTNRISSEIDSTSDPDQVYERIPYPSQSISNEPSASAPSSPAPTIKKLNMLSQENQIPESPHAYDPDGYLIPLEIRNCRQTFHRMNSGSGNCKWRLGKGHQAYDSYKGKHLISAAAAAAAGARRTCDPERLESFLDDSVAEFYRKRVGNKEQVIRASGKSERLYQRHNLSPDLGPFGVRHPISQRSSSTPEFSRQDLAGQVHEESDVYLDTIFDCDGAVELDEGEDDCSMHFLRPTASSLRGGRRCRSMSNAAYHNADSAAMSDSGIASRQSTMRKDQRYWYHWTAGDLTWEPPNDLSSLTVEEVAMSLRYIGMKDQIVASFSKEQVDGKLLCEMNNHLLKEGFPNMNSLERKKVLDFIQGWRPKRMLFL